MGRLADDARVDRGALAAGDHVGEVVEGRRIRQGAFDHLGAEPAERLGRRLDRRPHHVVDALLVVAIGHPDPEPGDRPVETGDVVRNRMGARGRVAGVGAGDQAQEDGRVAHRPGQRTDVVEGPRERHRARPTHAPVGGLEPHDAAAGGGQPDRAPRVGAERAVDEARRDGRARTRSTTRRRRGRGATESRRRRDGRCPRRVPIASSERFSRPSEIAPAASRRATAVASWSARKYSGTAVPQAAGRPPQTKRSLWARGTP